MNWISSDNYLALFFEINDDDLEHIKKDKDYFKDESFIRRIDAERGNNAHLYSLNIRGGDKSIVWGIRELLKKYDSVSWWTVRHRKFFIRRKNEI